MASDSSADLGSDSAVRIETVLVTRQREELRYAPVPTRPKFDHCVIHVSDWHRANAFYRDVLGADLVERPGGTWAYRFGTEQLNVHGPGVLPDPVARIPVAPGNSDLCFEWAGPIENALAHLSDHDVAIEEGPVARHGARGQDMSMYFRDPDGSLLEFISYVS